jgi:hypothetical protein
LPLLPNDPITLPPPIDYAATSTALTRVHDVTPAHEDHNVQPAIPEPHMQDAVIPVQVYRPLLPQLHAKFRRRLDNLRDEHAV